MDALVVPRILLLRRGDHGLRRDEDKTMASGHRRSRPGTAGTGGWRTSRGGDHQVEDGHIVWLHRKVTVSGSGLFSPRRNRRISGAVGRSSGEPICEPGGVNQRGARGERKRRSWDFLGADRGAE